MSDNEKSKRIARITQAEVNFMKLNTNFTQEAGDAWLNSIREDKMISEEVRDFILKMSHDEYTTQTTFSIFTLEQSGLSLIAYLKAHLSEKDFSLWWDKKGRYMYNEPEEGNQEA